MYTFTIEGPSRYYLKVGKKHLLTYMHDSQTLQKLPPKREVRISIFGPLQQSAPYNFETSGYKRQLFIRNNNVYNYSYTTQLYIFPKFSLVK